MWVPVQKEAYLVNLHGPCRKLREYPCFAGRAGKFRLREDVEHWREKSLCHHRLRHYVHEIVQSVEVARMWIALDARSVSHSYMNRKIKLRRVVVTLRSFVVPARQSGSASTKAGAALMSASGNDHVLHFCEPGPRDEC